MYIESRGVLAAAVAANATLSISLPTGFDSGRYQGGLDHRLQMNQSNLVSPVDFTVAANGALVTVTNKTGATWPSGVPFILQLNQPGDAQKSIPPLAFNGSSVGANLVLVNIGAPATASGTAILATTPALTAGANLLAAPIAVPGGSAGRALNVVSSTTDTTQIVTVVGKDAFGATLSQAFTLNGTTAVVGTKAFATVTGISVNIALAGNLSVGTINVFGLPVPLPMLGLVVKDLTDGAVSGTAGTFVVADTTSDGSTSSTGDVRGTYAPNTAANGTHYYHVLLAAPDAGYAGTPQA